MPEACVGGQQDQRYLLSPLLVMVVYRETVQRAFIPSQRKRSFAHQRDAEHCSFLERGLAPTVSVTRASDRTRFYFNGNYVGRRLAPCYFCLKFLFGCEILIAVENYFNIITMTQEFITKMQARLDEERQRLEVKLESGAGEIDRADGDAAVAFPNIGDDEEDNAQEVEIYDQRIAVARTFTDELGEVVAALQRIEDNTYGVCTKCGQPIVEARLEAFPAAAKCSACAD